MLGSDRLPRALARGELPDELDAADRAMLEYALALTRSPGDVGGADVERLRRAGFDDAAILGICQVTAYYAYVNRLADGLGVELEPRWREEDMVLTREELDAAADAPAEP